MGHVTHNDKKELKCKGKKWVLTKKLKPQPEKRLDLLVVCWRIEVARNM